MHRDDGSCCCLKRLSIQYDFASECSALQHSIETRISIDFTAAVETPQWFWGTDKGTRKRHICLFLPKFHCELNWIERYWAAAKHYVRSNCLYTLAGLRETIPLGLSQDLSDVPVSMQDRTDLPVAPVLKQRRWARISWRYADKYRNGADACEATEAVKSKRHHDTGDARMRKREAEMAAQADFLLGI